MNEQLGSMAREALSAVNATSPQMATDALSALAPRQSPDGAAGVLPDIENLAPKGLNPSGVGVEGLAPQAVPQPQPAIQPLVGYQPLGEAKSRVTERLRRQLGGVLAAAVRGASMGGASQAAEPATPAAEPATPQTPQTPLATPQTPPATPAAAPKVVMGGSLFGGRVPRFTRPDDVIVELGDDIDVNDAAALQKRMDETNALIDMMNSAYDEED